MPSCPSSSPSSPALSNSRSVSPALKTSVGSQFTAADETSRRRLDRNDEKSVPTIAWIRSPGLVLLEGSPCPGLRHLNTSPGTRHLPHTTTPAPELNTCTPVKEPNTCPRLPYIYTCPRSPTCIPASEPQIYTPAYEVSHLYTHIISHMLDHHNCVCLNRERERE